MASRSSTTARHADKPARPATPVVPPAKATVAKLPAPDVVGALYAEHQYAARLLDVLDEQVAAVARGEPLDREASLGVMTYMTRHPDAYHHPREDAMFARLVKRDPGLAKRIAQVQKDHRTIGSDGKKLLVALERLQQDSREDKRVAALIAHYARALRDHMAIEEQDLFPRARQVLDDHDLAEVDRALRRVLDPIFEAEVRDAYAAYSPVVRYLAEQPAIQSAVGLLDAFYQSASTLGEVMFGARNMGAPPKAKKTR